jgi:hypothetical protein
MGRPKKAGTSSALVAVDVDEGRCSITVYPMTPTFVNVRLRACSCCSFNHCQAHLCTRALQLVVNCAVAGLPFFLSPLDGEVKHDAIVKQGTNRERTVYTSLKDMKVRNSLPRRRNSIVAVFNRSSRGGDGGGDFVV